MPSLIMLVGLPGSGKTRLANLWVEALEGKLKDIAQAFPEVSRSNQYNFFPSKLTQDIQKASTSPKKVCFIDDIKTLKSAVNTLDQKPDYLIITDPQLCSRKALDGAQEQIPKLFPKWDCHWFFFRNLPETSIHNCKVRQAQGGHVVSEEEIKLMSKMYKWFTSINCFYTGENRYKRRDYMESVTILEPALALPFDKKELSTLIQAQSVTQDLLSHLPHSLEHKNSEGVNFVYLRWTTGGASGGSCYGTEAEQFDGDSEPDFTKAGELLDKLVPLSEQDKTEFLKDLIHEDYYTENEYYGNYTDYAVKYLDIREVVTKLATLGLYPPKRFLSPVKIEQPLETELELD